MIKKLTISEYKGFYAKQTLEFAVPDGQKDGSGLTIIVGPNNAGKTTIIESLLLGNGDKKFKENERHAGKHPSICLESQNGDKIEYTNDEPESSKIKIVGPSHNIQFEVVPSRRYWSHIFSGESQSENLAHHTRSMEIRGKNQEINLGSYLSGIRSNREEKEQLNSYLKELIPHFTDWTIDTNGAGQDYIKYKAGKASHESGLLGDGIISLFRIFAHLVHERGSVFIIDEPELSLHPSAQRRLSEIFSRLSRTKQIIVCTHSPYFTNWSDFINGAKFIRLNKHGDKNCTIDSLDNTKDYANFISRNINEFQKPQLLDLASKEILFSDRILFVEGQEDVGLIKKWFSEKMEGITFDIFGYGVSGHGNMKVFLEMAKDLNIERVGALYDSGTESYVSDKSTYSGEVFHFEELPTRDIRDKDSGCANGCPNKKVTEGVFSSSGELKSDYRVEFEKIIGNFKRFFTNSMQDEYLDLVNEKDEVIGKKWRSEVYAEGLSNFRVINCFLVNSEGKLWIPRRTAAKRLFPSCLDVSMGGHVESGEDYDFSFKRELAEELNIDADTTPWKMIGHLSSIEDGVSAFMNVYEIQTDEVPNFNPDDFTEYYWLTPEELLQRIADGDGAKGDLPKLVRKFYLKK